MRHIRPGGDSSPITTARMCAEVYDAIKNEDWSVVGTTIRLSWMHRLWDFTKPHQWNGSFWWRRRRLQPAGFAWRRARQQKRRTPSLWRSAVTATSCSIRARCGRGASQRFRCCTSCKNNRAYHQEYMYLVAMAARHGRGVDKMDIGTTIKDPNVDYAHRRARAWACMAKVRSPIRKTWRQRCSVPFKSSSPARPRWSTSSPIRAEEQGNDQE